MYSILGKKYERMLVVFTLELLDSNPFLCVSILIWPYFVLRQQHLIYLF